MKGKLPTELSATTVSQDVCLGCHEKARLAEAAVGVAVLTDSNGTVVNPHDLPANDDHAKNVSCVSCHKGHDTEAVDQTAPAVCLGCHHQDVYQCGTCHQ